MVTASNGQDSGYVNVTGYLVDGLNNFTFIDYNGMTIYCWAFQLKQNSQIIFSNVQGYNGDGSRTYQIVYNYTVSVNVTMCP